MTSLKQASVFVDTSFDTHIGLGISPDITAGDFKRELEKSHLSCFPSFGQIRVDGLMVKRKSFFYLLPDSIPMNHVFKGRAWFISAEIRGLNNPHDAKVGEDDALNHKNDGDSSGTPNTGNIELDIGKETINKNPQFNLESEESSEARAAVVSEKNFTGIDDSRKCGLPFASIELSIGKETRIKNPQPNLESEESSEVGAIVVRKKNSIGIDDSRKCGSPVASIALRIGKEMRTKNPQPNLESEESSEAQAAVVSKKPFTGIDDWRKCRYPVACIDQNQLQQELKRDDSSYSATQLFGSRENLIVRTSQMESCFKPPAGYVNPEVGKRLVVASNNIRTCGKKQSPLFASIWRSKTRRFLGQNSAASSCSKYLVFEIPESED